MRPLVQPFPAPRTFEEYLALRPRMIDTLGRPLVLAPCDLCGHEHFTVEPHMADVECPDCGSKRRRCLRPSQHDTDQWHKARRDAFEELCGRLEAEGVPMVARWAEAEVRADLALFDFEVAS